MKIYLLHSDTFEWKLHDSEDKDFKQQLEDRKIVIGDGVSIGDGVFIGYKVSIGDGVSIGNEVSIGDGVSIGNYAKIGKDNILSAYSLFYHLGIITQKDTAIVYKAVQENLTDYYSEKYQYKIGEGDERKIEPNQSLDCGDGWHFLNLEGAVKWHKEKGSKGKIISAEIKIKDILHIGWKVRVRAFSNVKLANVDYLLK